MIQEGTVRSGGLAPRGEMIRGDKPEATVCCSLSALQRKKSEREEVGEEEEEEDHPYSGTSCTSVLELHHR